jgi:hypothetical protein
VPDFTALGDFAFSMSLADFTDLEEGTCGLTGGGNEAVFSTTPAADGTVTITAGPGDLIVYAREATCGGDELSCEDNDNNPSGVGNGEVAEFDVTGGTTYFWFVGAWGSYTGTTNVQYTFTAD